MKYRVAFFVSAIAGLTLVAASSLANLLGVNIVIYPRVVYSSTSTSALTYTASSHLFTITAPPTSIQFSGAEGVRLITGTKSLTISVLVDNSGNLIGGVPANGGIDFTLSGTVSRIVGGVTNTYTGVLLTGAVTGFGFLESGPTDLYDFRFNPTGGALSNFFSCGDIGVQVTSAASTFTGSFSTNFNGQAKGTMVLEDFTPPTITCPFDNISVTNVQCSVQGGQAGAYVTFPDPTATDNCGTNVLMTCSPTNGSFFALAPATNMTSYTVICTAVDPSHNTNSCAFVVTIEDVLAPEFASNPVIDACGVAPITLTTDPGLCSATFTFPKPIATDSCCTSTVPVGVSAIDDLGFIVPLTEFTSNSIVYETGHFPQSCLGSNVITSTANDGRGNSAQAQCAVLVFDNEPPSIVCSNNQTVACTNGPVFYVDPIAWDNCTNLTVSCTPPNGSFLGIGSYPITCIAIDNCGGNSNSCSFTLNVVDITPPVISCPTDITVDCSQSTDPSSTGTATATDDCDPNPSVSYSDAVSGTCPQFISRTWTATDNSRNSRQCTQIITVTDTVAPTITFVPAGGDLGCNPTLPTDASVKSVVTATDNCGTPTINVGHVDGGT
ncbi:MAG: HYR domain-containing protein, partial [Verrucomicrobiia bacterium]